MIGQSGSSPFILSRMSLGCSRSPFSEYTWISCVMLVIKLRLLIPEPATAVLGHLLGRDQKRASLGLGRQQGVIPIHAGFQVRHGLPREDIRHLARAVFGDRLDKLPTVFRAESVFLVRCHCCLMELVSPHGLSQMCDGICMNQPNGFSSALSRFTLCMTTHRKLPFNLVCPPRSR